MNIGASEFGADDLAGPQAAAREGNTPREVCVDVGLTAYRRATYIGEAIESVLAQSFDRWRLTICDNGPGGGEIEEAIQPYLSDPRVSHYVTGRELSLAENWTTALNQGTGPYVAVLNDDDRWHPDYLRARVDALESHPECGFAFSPWLYIDERGATLRRARVLFREGVLSRETLAYWFTRQNLVVPPTVVVRRSACEKVGAYFDETWQWCDWELWARLSARFPAYYLTRHDNDYRRHAEAAAYAFSEREAPEQLLAMVDLIEQHFTRELEAFRLSRLTRARNRSRILLHVAGDIYEAGGWKASGTFHKRALREYPPTVFTYQSLAMLAKTVLGRRASRIVARLLRPWRRDAARNSAAT